MIDRVSDLRRSLKSALADGLSSEQIERLETLIKKEIAISANQRKPGFAMSDNDLRKCDPVANDNDDQPEDSGDHSATADKTYYCTACGRNPVDAENGYDTCAECLANR